MRLTKIVFRNNCSFSTLQAYRIFNTWLGDHARLITLEAVIKKIKEQDLLSLVRQSGKVLLEGLKTLEVSYFSNIY